MINRVTRTASSLANYPFAFRRQVTAASKLSDRSVSVANHNASTGWSFTRMAAGGRPPRVLYGVVLPYMFWSSPPLCGHVAHSKLQWRC
jgi:hypothetical protein